MSQNLSFQDHQLISAYLDNACTEKQRALIEKRLQKEPELLHALREFEHSRRLLKTLPVKRVPRNFTLSPSLVPVKPKRFLLAPILNFTAAAAALMLIVVFVGTQLFPGTAGAPMMAKSAAPMAADATVANSAQSAPMIITWGQGSNTYGAATAKGMGGGGSGMGGGPVTAPQPGITSASPTAESPSLLGAAPAAQAEENSSLILGIPAAADQGKIISPLPETQSTVPQPPATNVLIEIALGAAAIICALAAWLVRKTR
ncbi:MAG: anti-sigma factor [Anaerolineaceae bacterium]